MHAVKNKNGHLQKKGSILNHASREYLHLEYNGSPGMARKIVCCTPLQYVYSQHQTPRQRATKMHPQNTYR